MLIKGLFDKDVTRDIPPVVYFHEQDPARLRSEVDEYIITGGFPKGDPRARRVQHGIHEAYVGLLNGIVAELQRPGGPDLPASWISGFFGSGKSSFAKLLGMAIDGAALDDGRPLATALLGRDDSPLRQELVDAWKGFLSSVDPIAVVFDVGAVARDNEHIHTAALRQLQVRLGYCPKSSLVASWELKLERDGLWQAFLGAALATLGKPWDSAKVEELAEDHFSHILHVLDPDRYTAPMDWIDTHAGVEGGAGTSPAETIDAMAAMLLTRAKGKTLFLVIDEVSQYIHQDDPRTLKLQSFVSELGRRLKGAAWLFATGQQRFEDTGDTDSISKLKDRFPERLRVHLATSNIRDVVHKRLLGKRPEAEPILRSYFQTHRPDLKLYGYACEDITEEDFVEVYPMLPGHVDLLMQITSNLRTRSTRVQGDDHAIRGLLQLLGELFRKQQLAEGEVGELVTLDAIYEVQHSALDPDVQTALGRIVNHAKFRADELALRAARAVALLELIQEQMPTTAVLVAQCLYSRLGLGSQVQAVTEALERLRGENLLGYSEKQGYKIQSSAGQEWERERRDVPVTADKRSELVRDTLRELIGTPDRPRHRGTPFPWAALFSDSRSLQDDRVQDPRTGAAVTVDFRFLTSKEDRGVSTWVQRSDQVPLRDRIVWVVGDPGRIDEIARELLQSRYMVQRYQGRRDSLPGEKQRVLIEEQGRLEGLENRIRDAVAETFFDGTLYFRGASKQPRDFGGSFATALTEAGNRWLPDLFPHFTEIAITDTELNQLLERDLSGPSNKFMEKGLGILSLDAGRYVATCDGDVPRRILVFIEAGGTTGNTLINQFSKPPFGYPIDVLRACLAGLLRAAKIRIRPEEGPEITSVRDPGTKDLFRRVKEGLGRADIHPSRETEVTGRDRVAICKLFEDYLGLQVERENDAIADAVFQQFPGRREALRGIETQLNRLPGRPALPEVLERLSAALEGSMRTRQVEQIVVAAKRNLDALRDGLELLSILRSELTDEAVEQVRAAAAIREHHLAQLEAIQDVGELTDGAQALKARLDAERPWRAIQDLVPVLEKIQQHYLEVRRALITQQSQRMEAARRRVQTRDGFARLDADQVHRVLRPITEAMISTDAEATSPPLRNLREAFPTRLAEAEERANELLDEELSRQTSQEVVTVSASLRGREVASRQQLEGILQEVEDRIGPLVDQGKRVRIV